MSKADAIINLLFTLDEALSMKRCPFCGKQSATLNNTHTASYWIECFHCGAEVHGRSYEPRKGRATRAHHRKAKRSAMAAWNRRDG